MSPGPERVPEIRIATSAVEGAANALLEWLTGHPSHHAEVNVAFRRAWSAYQDAALTMAGMTPGQAPLTLENGEVAGAAIELARRENSEGALAFVQAAGP
jgi:hypothetical protein